MSKSYNQIQEQTIYEFTLLHSVFLSVFALYFCLEICTLQHLMFCFSLTGCGRIVNDWKLPLFLPGLSKKYTLDKISYIIHKMCL